uniref:Helicase C-terminal domain-containing protein n=1 Tax=Vannella robusta TaxID=1487602 RepID=A0A7S4HL04_9EUKA
MERFTDTSESSARIMLVSSKSSAAGTHLAVATHVLLLDPASGTKGDAKATDAQAIARAHRLGQDSTVVAVRFIVANTIDQESYERVYGALVTRKGPAPKSARSAR